MKQNVVNALALIALTIVLIMLNNHNMKVNIGFAKITAPKSLIFFTFTSIGTAIGLMVKK